MDLPQTDSVSLDVPSQFQFCGQKVAKNQVTYFTQITVIYAIIVTSIVHISLESPNKELWLILLSSSLGYILPTPALKYLKNSPVQEKK